MGATHLLPTTSSRTSVAFLGFTSGSYFPWNSHWYFCFLFVKKPKNNSAAHQFSLHDSFHCDVWFTNSARWNWIKKRFNCFNYLWITSYCQKYVQWFERSSYSVGGSRSRVRFHSNTGFQKYLFSAGFTFYFIRLKNNRRHDRCFNRIGCFDWCRRIRTSNFPRIKYHEYGFNCHRFARDFALCNFR